jgi:hypothetical protein
LISIRKQIKPAIVLTYATDGDTNGLVYYLGTNGLASTFTNPAITGILPVLTSSTEGFTPNNLTDRIQNEWYSGNSPGSWAAWDIGNYTISIQKYTIRSRSTSNTNHPRTWVLEGTNTISTTTIAGFNAATWTTIDSRLTDTTLSTVNQYYTMTANASSNSFRYLRMRNTGVESSGTNYLVLGEIEFYGTLSFN